MKIGLFFGSFNPMHIGHLAIANYMAEFTDLDQVWIVVSPHNPLKSKNILADSRKRLAAAKKAVGKNSKIKVVDVEFSLPKPSYTIDTLSALSERYPGDKFVLIIGSDNLKGFSKWKDYKKILKGFEIYVYPRSGKAGVSSVKIIPGAKKVKLINAPRIDISSTFIREQLKKGKDMRYFMA